MSDPEFFKKLLSCTLLPWSFIGTSAYLRKDHGVFKLDLWDGGGGREHIAGLCGTYTSRAGAQDHLVFEFHALLVPDRGALKNPDLANTHRICAWHVGSGAPRAVEWYVPPVSLAPLHEAIAAWVVAWDPYLGATP